MRRPRPERRSRIRGGGTAPWRGPPATDLWAYPGDLTNYNARGEAWQTIDPAGRVTEITCDDQGRAIDTVENYSPRPAPT